MRYPILAIVGRPNVGKSTLFNRIVGDRVSIVDDTRGVTRDRLYSRASWANTEFIVIDTGGIEVSENVFSSEIAVQANLAIDEADVIVFVVNVRDGVIQEDEEVASILYKSKKPVIIAVNKVDDAKYMDDVYEFYQFGFDSVVGVSSIHGIGIGDLLESIHSKFPVFEEEVDESDQISLSLIGRPNVGKSSIFNALVNEERVIVSDVAGTTRDAIDTKFTYDGQTFNLIDTAGIKKRGKIYESVDKYSVLRTISALNRSDVAVLVLDASTDILEQDKNVVKYALDSGCALVIAVNKWDLVKKDNNTVAEWTKKIRSHFPFISYANIVFVSATTKQRIYNILNEVILSSQNYTRRVQTSVLNNVLVDATFLNQAPDFKGGRLKIYYGSQVSVSPPTFALFVNQVEFAHFSYIRYIENTLRDYFDFRGTPIKIILRARS